MSHKQKEVTDDAAKLPNKTTLDDITTIISGSPFTQDLSAEDVEGFQSLERMEDEVGRLEQILKDYQLTPDQRSVIERHARLISSAIGTLSRGKFFSSLEDLWDDSLLKPFDGVDVDINVFNRSHYVNNVNYKRTADEAKKPESLLKSDDSTSKPKKPSQNIFGETYNPTSPPPSAHLMPKSVACASCWYHFVPWVLSSSPITEIVADSEQNIVLEKAWLYMQKCMHGVIRDDASVGDDGTSNALDKKRKADNSDEQSCGQGSGNHEMNTRSSNTSKGAGSVDEGGGEKTSNASGNTRVSNIGIKHFQSNRILLRDQAQSFDQNHRVLIIPIMELNGVKAWCGEMYDAIVLVSDKSNDAHNIYQRIEAGSGTLRFATEDECKIARALLESMILCVCKSFQETFEIYFPDDGSNSATNSKKVNTTLKDVTKSKRKVLLEAFEKLKGQGNFVHVPKSKDWTVDKTINVRKIRFTDIGVTETNPYPAPDAASNPAPDPALLLGKSTTNWLKLHELTLLPVCDSDLLSCDGSDSTASSGAEAVARGWWTEPGKRPRRDEIVWNPTSDESLSDLDDDEL